MPTLVTFNDDVFPYVKGDVVKLDAEEKARVDAMAKQRNLSNPYTKGNQAADTVDDTRTANEARARADREAAKTNAVDQAAQLEAQRAAVAEPANVDALGIQQETPATVVTGTPPVEGVEVTNPQEATDTSKAAGAKVKGSK